MKLGFVSTPVTGHLNPMTALARKLQSRRNEVVFIGLPDAEPIVRAANLNFVDLAADVIERAFKKNQILDSARQAAAPSHM
jgi:UDP:flavonoid glycosyltransferase YjiC (YdhE family)